jgi:hypothetical protein
LQECAHFEGDLPRVILAKVTGLHAFLSQFGHEIGGGRAAGFEVTRILARAFALAEEHELEEPWVLQGMVEIDVENLRQAFFYIAGEARRRELDRQFVEALVCQGVQERRAVRVVPIDRHRRDANGIGDLTHGDGIGTFLVQETACGDGDLLGGGTRWHVYSVYHT